MKTTRHLTGVAGLLVLLLPLVVADTNAMDFEDLSLEDALNMEVTTVSKRSERIADAPAVITVITAEQIEELGAMSLPEVMSFVPGFSLTDTYWKPGIVTARGIKMNMYNDKILMLIDGVPAYDGAAMEHFLDTVPVTAIERIEVIRGPGSVLYGANAFSAVINLITRDAGDQAEPEGYVRGGSFGLREMGLAFGHEGEQADCFIAGTTRDDDGYSKAAVDEGGARNDINYEKDNDAFFGKVAAGEFRLSGGYLFQKFGKYGPAPAFTFADGERHMEDGKGYHEKYYLNGLWSHAFSERFSTRLTLHYDYMDKQTSVGEFFQNVYVDLFGLVDETVSPDYYSFGGKVYRAEWQANYRRDERLNLIGGVTAERRTVYALADMAADRHGPVLFQGATRDLPFHTEDYGVYLQADGGAGRLGYAVGMRYSELGIPEEGYVTPRAALTWRLAESSSVKLLYGEAFRGAGPQEQYYLVPQLVYGADALDRALEPERIRTYELALDQQIAGRHNVRLNAYHMQVRDIIGRRDATPAESILLGDTSGKIYDNLGDQTVQGFEIDLSGYPAENLRYFANLAWKDGEETLVDGTERDIEFVEDITFNAGLSWWATPRWRLSPNIQYIGAREGTTVSGESVGCDAFTLLNLVTHYRLNERMVLSLSMHNLLDAEYAYPEYVRRKDSALSTEAGGPVSIPGGPGRSLFATLSFGL